MRITPRTTCPCGAVVTVEADTYGYRVYCRDCYDYAPDAAPCPIGHGKTSESAIADFLSALEMEA